MLLTKLNIFLSSLLILLQATQKKIRNLSFQLGLRGRNDLRMGRKLANFQFFFSVQGTGGSPTGPGAENRVDDQDIRSTDRPASCGLGVPREPDNFHAKTRLSS